MGPPVIAFQEVSKSFGERKILDRVSFQLEQGEILGIIGPSGAGKTTILRTLIGFYTPDSGTVRFQDNVVKGVEDLAWDVGFATQDECFYDDLTCEENLEYFGTMYRISRQELKQRIPKLLKMVELGDAAKTKGGDLSGGMRRRLDVAIALLHQPKVLILDEPTSGLDPVLRKHMLALIESIKQQGIAVIITSHLLEELEHLCDRVVMIFKGQVMAVGPPAEIASKHFPYREVHLVTYPGRYRKLYGDVALRRPSMIAVRLEGHKLIISTARPEDVVYAIMQSLPGRKEHLIDIDIKKPSLNKVFEQIVQTFGEVDDAP